MYKINHRFEWKYGSATKVWKMNYSGLFYCPHPKWRDCWKWREVIFSKLCDGTSMLVFVHSVCA